MKEHVLILHPDGRTARLIAIPEQVSDHPLTMDELLMVALHKEIKQLKHDLANARCASAMAAERLERCKTCPRAQEGA